MSTVDAEVETPGAPVQASDPPAGHTELTTARDTGGSLPLVPGHEHVIFVATGQAAAGETELSSGRLLYLAPGRDSVALTARAGTRLLLLGGDPLLMWWNFVARTPDDITQAARAWAGGQFVGVTGYRGVPMAAPPLDPARLRPAR